MDVAQRPLSGQLAEFFDRLSVCRAPVEVAVIQKPVIDLDAFAAFMSDLEQPLIAARQGAFQFDPWEVAGLGSDEVRNTGVLAWLLNPQGSHGLGLMAMHGLLALVNSDCRAVFGRDIAVLPGRPCRVRTEINPSGEVADRVDIEVDAENFYLIVEVKIYAPEQPGQLERYCRQARVRAGQRPWAVIFLTPQGRVPDSAGEYAGSGRIVPLSWKKLAATLERKLPGSPSEPGRTLSLSQRIAMQAVRRFLKKIRSF